MPQLRRAVASCLIPLSAIAAFGSPVVAQAPRDPNVTYTPALFSAMKYRMVGPFRGGRSTAVTGVATEPNTFYMGTTGGGVWKTTDAGETWTNVSDGFFGVASIGAVEVADADPNVIYAGTGSACIRGNVSAGRGIYRSTDAGKTWTIAGLRDAGQISRVVIHPKDPNLVYVAALGHAFGKNADRGVFRSKDGGTTWQKVLFVSDSTGAVDLAMNAHNPREIYAGMWRGERKPWSLISGATDGGVYKTTDGGDTWVKLGGGLPNGMVGKVGVTVSPANADRVWAIVEAEPDGGVYRSDDAGKTWQRVNSENRLRQRAWYYTHIYADPKDQHTVYVLNTGFYRSVDGGRTFEQVRVLHGDMHAFWANPHQPDVMIVGDDGGAQVSLNGGKSWSALDNQPTAELYDVAVDNAFPYQLYGAQQDNTTIRVPAWTSSNTIHPNEHWKFVGGCETGPVALHPDHPEVVYAGCYGGVIDRYDFTKDQRRNMVLYPQLQLAQALRDLRYRFQWTAPIVVSPHDPNVVYHGSQRMHRSTDGGVTWETLSGDLTTNTPEHQGNPGGPINHDGTGVEVYNTIFAIAVSPQSANVIWTGSDDGRVHVSRDNGRSWTEVTPRGMPRFGTVNRIELSSHQDGRAFIAVQRYRFDDFAPYVFRTNDFGASWELLTNGTNGIPADHPVRAIREDPDRRGLLYAGTEFGLFVSFNDGRTWQSLQLNLPVTPVTGLVVRHQDLALSTQGRSFWILDDLTPLHQLNDEVARASLHLFKPRDAVRADQRGDIGGRNPDPAPNGAIVHYSFAAAPGSPVTLEVLDARGGLVRRTSSDSAQAKEWGEPVLPAKAGMNRMVWDLMYPGPKKIPEAVIWGYQGGVKAPPGTYQVRVSVGGQSRTQSFEVLRDPRLTDVTQVDFEEQFRVSAAVRDTITRVYDVIRAIRTVREQLVAAASRAADAGVAGEWSARADSIGQRLGGVLELLMQVKSQSGQDPIRFPGQLDNQYYALYENVAGLDEYRYGGPEGRPSRGAYERFTDLNAQWEDLRGRVQRLLATDVAAFNEALTRAGVPAVAVPRLERPIP